MNRREALARVPLGTLAAFTAAATLRAGPAAAQQLSHLQEDDPTAVEIHYKRDASKVDRAKVPKYVPGQTCANCSLYAGAPGDTDGGCGLFIDKDVAAAGWCDAWDKKAG
ncbi:high-potential iron-sulfur protein [Ideonella azotifigens]|uniref:High-potential iron-sulfur protein n=2 Tax=Ideonella azotifigens TaxID=513160 RepID=A0ABP3VEL3_9BURK|nr:high-potential iron-sulfur protein [Ideonella azotifigens]MCD2342192.1 high-potential iron-sulfur protein [Ideonella azotifigens]